MNKQTTARLITLVILVPLASLFLYRQINLIADSRAKYIQVDGIVKDYLPHEHSTVVFTVVDDRRHTIFQSPGISGDNLRHGDAIKVWYNNDLDCASITPPSDGTVRLILLTVAGCVLFLILYRWISLLILTVIIDVLSRYSKRSDISPQAAKPDPPR